ncbi:MAG: transketolase [Gammaproteobacteria bacterium RIFCSPHIGHO2_02_FULL_42_13]|nr:MAG: transketolase [Gammaproteobacteria bacterium RIFCSPHIGHO2_02_FULL_42_13]
MSSSSDISALCRQANEIRKDIIRMLCEAGSGHPGGSLSATDILTALYFKVLRHDPKNPKWPDRDRVILSKGHGAPALYAALAHAGYFPIKDLMTLRKLDSPLQGHPDMRRLPGLEASTGSLGQGLSIGVGTALAGRLDKKGYYSYVILSDGETNEGQTWEAASFAAHHGLDHLIAIMDYNKFQLDDAVKSIIDMEPVVDKWKAFNWQVFEIDGHDMKLIVDTLEQAKKVSGKPIIIVAHTIKGKGISFMENNNHYHGVAPTKEEAERALKELEAKKL